MSIAGGSALNSFPPDAPLSVRVRIYQLADGVSIANTFFADVWEDDAKALGDALLEKQEVTVRPGERQDLTLERDRDARMLAAVALFREPQGRDWVVGFEYPEEPSTQEAGCQPPPTIKIWADRMKIQDGAGQSALQQPDGVATPGH